MQSWRQVTPVTHSVLREFEYLDTMRLMFIYRLARRVVDGVRVRLTRYLVGSVRDALHHWLARRQRQSQSEHEINGFHPPLSIHATSNSRTV